MVKKYSNLKTAIFLVMFLLCSCSSAVKKDVFETLESVKDKYVSIESVRDVFLENSPAVLYQDNLNHLDTPVSVKLDAVMPLADFLNMLVTGQGFNLVLYGPEDINKKSIYVSVFLGTLGSLLLDISNNYGLFIQFKNGIISVKQEDTFFVSLFNYLEIDKYLEKQIISLGGKQVSYDVQNQRLVFTSDKSAFVRISDYLRLLSKDFSFIDLHLVLLDVEESGSKTHGIDVYRSILDMSLGRLALDTAGLSLSKGLDGSFSLLAKNEGLNVGLFLSYLKQYSTYKVLQDVQIGMVNTYIGKIESFQKIPYIDKVSVASTTGGTQQGVEVKEVDTGSNIEISSKYDFNNNLLFISVNAVYQNFLRYISLSTGSSGVTFNRPLISKRLLNTRFVMSPNEILIIGGVSSESETSVFDGIDSINVGMDKTTNSKSRLIIFIKPRITRYIYFKEKNSALP